MNELIFVVHTVIIASTALLCLYLGKEALVGFISVQCILANLFVIKQTTLFGLTATCADAYSIGAVLGLNLLQEYYGRALAQKSIWVSFMLLVFYALAAQLHLTYLPCTADTTQLSFATIMDAMPRLVIASFIVYLVVQHIDAFLYAWLKIRLHGNYLVMRTCLSIGICQLMDTILFSFFGLWGLVDNMFEIIIVSYGIKLAAIGLAAPFIALSKRLITIE